MRGTQLTPIVALRELGRLFDVYPRPKHYPTDDGALARLFCEICADVSAEQFTQAVSEYLRGANLFMPKPGALRVLAQAQPGLNGASDTGSFARWVELGFRTHSDGPLTPCPACGRAWQWSPRLMCVHDHARHVTLAAACIGRCDDRTHYGPGPRPSAPVRESAGDLWMAEAADTERAAIQAEAI